MANSQDPLVDIWDEVDDSPEDLAKRFRDIDPFPNIPPALLSSEHIQAYVRATGMLSPFYPNKSRLKAASYEINPGGNFVRWEDGKKYIEPIDRDKPYVLPPNSITFMQIDTRIRLPDYIAIRFNLRIQHVHRGLLLGTGPLIDPGFEGELVIPLHNLTSEAYTINSKEGLIWVEFTKTTRGLRTSYSKDCGLNKDSYNEYHFFSTDREKTRRKMNEWFEKANKNNPIESSLPKSLKEAKKNADEARRDARRAKQTTTFFATVGVLTIAGTVVALLSYFVAILQLVKDVAKAANDADSKASIATQKIESLEAELKKLTEKQTLAKANEPRKKPIHSRPSPRSRLHE